MLKLLQKLGRKITDFHLELSYELAEIKQKVQRTKNSQDHVNTAYFMREIGAHLQDVAKEAKKVQEVAEFVGTMVLDMAGHTDKVRTPYVTATPYSKVEVSVPHHKRDPEEFRAFMEFLGIPIHYWNCEEPVVNLRWNGIQDRVNRLLAEGKPLPKGLNLSRQSSESRFRLTKRREIGEQPESYIDEGRFLFDLNEVNENE